MLCDLYCEQLEYQENLLVRYYRKHGHEVTVLASTFDSIFDFINFKYDRSRPARTFFHRGAKIIKLPYRYNIVNRLRAFPGVLNILQAEKPDLIFVHDITPNLTECVAYIRSHPDCRMILDYHADYSNSAKNWLSLKILHGVIRKFFLKRARPYLSCIFPVVPTSAVFLNEVYGVAMPDMELLPLGADTDLGEEVRTSGARSRLRNHYGIGPNGFVVFTGGKLDPLKRTEELIKAVRGITDPNVHLVVVGEAAAGHQSYKDMLLGFAGGADNIHFAGWLNTQAVYEHLDLADIAVFPASQSALWQQAISMGLPLVIGDTINVSNGKQDVSYLNTKGNIIIVDPNLSMAEELTKYINILAADESLRSRMADGARHVSDQLLNWNTLIQKTLRFNTVPVSLPQVRI